MLSFSSFGADLSFFEKSLEMYGSQQRDALSIQQDTHLGLLLVDKQRFREQFQTSLWSCLEVTCIGAHMLTVILLLLKQVEGYIHPNS